MCVQCSGALSTIGNILSTVEDVLSTVRNIQYWEEYHNKCGVMHIHHKAIMISSYGTEHENVEVLIIPMVLEISFHIYHDIEHPHGTQDISPWYSM